MKPHHILKYPASPPDRAEFWCGASAEREFHFTRIDHMVHTHLFGSAMMPCKNCYRAAQKAFLEAAP